MKKKYVTYNQSEEKSVKKKKRDRNERNDRDAKTITNSTNLFKVKRKYGCHEERNE